MTEDPRETAIAKAIRGAVCPTSPYPPHVWRTGEAEANIQEWCKWAARAVLAVIDEPIRIEPVELFRQIGEFP